MGIKVIKGEQTVSNRWDVAIIFLGTALGALIGVPLYAMTGDGYSPTLWFGFVVFLVWNGLSITAGYHRLWSHRSYDAHFLVRLGFALGGALSVQNSIRSWCSNHRTHHQFTDDVDRDPYCAKRGLWYSHIGWMLRDYDAAKTNYANIRDLDKDRLIQWQHNYYWPLAIALNVIVPLIIGAVAGDAIGGLMLMGFLRLFLCHHTTFFINSLAHFWGKQPYSDQTSSRDNSFISLLTYGEGYHNFHHTFQWDYRNGIQWYQFDPTKWLIMTLSWTKLAYGLKVTLPEKIEMSQAQMQLKTATEKVSQFNTITADKWLVLLEAEFNELVTSINEWSACRQQWLELKRRNILKQLDETELFSRLKELEMQLNMQRYQWRMLTQQFA